MTAAYKYITDTGVIVADATDLLSDVQTEYQNALGSAINLDASTPQGSLMAAEVIARTDVMRNNAELANMMNPNLAYGTFLDAICALLGITRGVNQSTVLTGVLITGNNSTVVQAGYRVQTAAGDIFSLIAAVTIPIGGSIRANFQSAAYGPIPAAVGAMTILDGTIGWAGAAVDGSTTIVLGTSKLADPQLKNMRNQQLAVQGVGSSAAIKAAALGVPNVTSVMVVENNTGSTGLVNGITFTKANAMWVCVAGTPTNANMAAALYAAHNGGCPWDYGSSGNGAPVGSPNGISTIDPATGLTYNVKWTTPILFDCYINISVHPVTSATSSVTAVQNAIMNYATGQEAGESGFVIGASISAFEIAGAVARQLPGLYVKTCSVACVPAGNPAPSYPSGYTPEFVMSQYGQAQIQINNITVQLV